MDKKDYNMLFEILSNNLEKFIEEVKKKKSTSMATDEWTVKDVLCHLVFWHENYAANYNALANHKEPQLLDGPGYRLNTEGVRSLRRSKTEELINRLKIANNKLYQSIVNKRISKMTYKKNGRVFSTSDFLYLIARHFVTHTKHIKSAKQE